MSAVDDPALAARMLGDRLARNRRHLGKWARRAGVSCWRWYDRDIPDVPITIDDYQGALVVADCRRATSDDVLDPAWFEAVVAVVTAAAPGQPIHARARRRMVERRARGLQYQRQDDAGTLVEVEEGGRRFGVNLTDYLDTGLFLDHRVSRGQVGERARDRRVLNLFCYTGAFTVYAATGGAAATVSVDLSNTYLDWAADNLARNRVAPAAHAFERADVAAWLAAYRGPRFDLIVVDPPTFSNSKKMQGTFDVLRDHVGLLAGVARVAAPGAEVWFSTNHRSFRLADRALPAWQPRETTRATVPPDFGYSRPHRSWRFTAPAAPGPHAPG
ncbi:MAG: class I SAM-dependent methyltransferase [Kofleriaceae bacterium]